MRSTYRTLIMCLAAGAVAAATTIIPMSLEALTRAAAVIVEGRAVRSWSAWNTQHTLIYTYTTVEVAHTLKGASGQAFTVKQLGGSADGYTQKVSGVRQFENGEDALLFLRPSVTGDGTMVVVGLMQGHFRVYAGDRGDTVVDISGTPLPLRAAESRIARALTQ